MDSASEESTDTSAGGDKTAEFSSQGSDFLADADAPQGGLVVEFVDFLKYNKKWWLTPILLVLALIAVLVVISATGGAPFIYALF